MSGRRNGDRSVMVGVCLSRNPCPLPRSSQPKPIEASVGNRGDYSFIPGLRNWLEFANKVNNALAKQVPGCIRAGHLSLIPVRLLLLEEQLKECCPAGTRDVAFRPF